MKFDYSSYPIEEAASEEICALFVEAIKLTDTKLASRRLFCLINSNQKFFDFPMLMAEFSALKDCKTSAD